MQELSRRAVVKADFSFLVAQSRYRRHPRFSADMLVAQRRSEVADCLAGQGFACVMGAPEQPTGLVAYRSLKWDSQHFGVPMGRLLVCKAADIDEPAWHRNLAEAIERAQAMGCRHLSVEVDIDDYASLKALFALGFELVDIKRTFVTNVCKVIPAYERFGSDIRPAEPEDHQAIMNLVQDVQFTSRFTRDASLDASRSRQLYESWLHNHLQNLSSGQTMAIVFARRGQVEACGVLGETDLACSGLDYRVRSVSLYVSRKGSTGAYGPVIYHMTRRALQTHDAVEATVSLNNAAAMRVVENIRPNRSTIVHCLRLFLDECSIL